MTTSVTLDQIPAYLKERVGFWSKVSGKSEDELLKGFQFEILLLESMLDKLSGGATCKLPNPLPLPLQQAPSQPVEVNEATTYTSSSPQQIVNLTIGQTITSGSSFGNFTAPFDGIAVLSVALSGGGVLSMEAQLPTGTSATAQLIGGTKLSSNQWVDIPVTITNGNKYVFECDTAGTASFQIVGYQNPAVLSPFTMVSSGGTTGVVVTNYQLTGTSATTVLTYSVGAANQALLANLELDVITATTTVTALLSYTNPNTGAQTFYWENGTSMPVGSQSEAEQAILAQANTTVTVVITAGTANQVFATTSIEVQS